MKENLLGERKSERGYTLLMVVLLLAEAVSAVGQIIPSDRRIGWNPGVPGGIANRTTIYATLNPGDNIQTTINNCPAGQVVKLNAGTFTITGGLTINKAVTLRGAGRDLTTINFTPATTADIIVMGGSINAGSSIAITAGFASGSTNLTVADASTISVNDFILIAFIQPAWIKSTGENGTCSWCGYNNPNSTATQIVRVSGKSGNNLMLQRPLYLAVGTSPFIRRLNMVQGAGCEDFTLWRSGGTGARSGQNFLINAGAYCWIKNVKSLYAGNRHVQLMNSYACEVRDSWFSDGYDNSSDHSYGVFCFEWNSDHLVENNIFYRCRHSLIFEGGGSGCVFGYNYCVGVTVDTDDDNWLSGDLVTHGAHPYMNLFEGNIVGRYSLDNNFGSASHNTLFRSWVLNHSSQTVAPESARWGANIDAQSWSNNLVGCIIGQPGDTGLRFAVNNGWGQSSYALGGWGDSSREITDTNVAATTYIHGSYDFIGHAILWDASNADHTLPDSCYLASKPAWFGNLTWPAFDPAKPATANITNLPAGHRFVLGINPSSSPRPSRPVYQLLLSVTSGRAPLEVSFVYTAPSGTTCLLDFGDGTHTNNASSTHTYRNTFSSNVVYVPKIKEVSAGSTNTVYESSVHITVSPP